MNKIFIGFIIVIFFASTGLGIYGYFMSEDSKGDKNKDVDVTLEAVVDKFTNSQSVKSFIENGAEISALAQDNTINITADGSTSTYTLTDGILTTTLATDDLSGAVMLLALVDSVGQLHGYSDGETFPTLNSEQVKDYTIKKGFEMVVSGDNVTAKIDINKKLELVDFTSIYIEVADLSDYSEYIKGDGSAQTSKGNLTFYKSGYDDEAIITIGEKDKLTNNAYKSLLSTIELIYDKAEADNFADSYPKLSNKSFGRYIIELNPELDDMESFIFSDENIGVVRLTIDKSK